MSSKTFNNTKINVEFDEDYQSRTNINSGENISSLFAKIRRFILDLKAVCFSGSYNDLSDTPDVVTKEYVDPVKSQAAINRTTLGTQCKNLLKNNAVTKTVSGVTFTINDDKSITVNGTATAQISFTINNKVGLGIGNYILTGCPSGGSWNTFYLTAYASSAWLTAPDFGSGCKIENKTVTQVVISIASGYTANNLKFYPMLRDADITDSNYELYKPSLQEQIDNFGTQQQLLCDYSSAATSSVTIQIAGLFSNYSAVICTVKYYLGTTSITLPLKYIKSIGKSKEYSPVSELGFRYVDDNNLFIGGADAAISNVKIISLY